MVVQNGIQNGMSTTIDTTIDAAGRLIVPKSMRDALHLTPGGRVRLRLEGDHIEIARHPVEARIDMADGFPAIVCEGEVPYAATDLESVRDALRDERANDVRPTR